MTLDFSDGCAVVSMLGRSQEKQILFQLRTRISFHLRLATVDLISHCFIQAAEKKKRLQRRQPRKKHADENEGMNGVWESLC